MKLASPAAIVVLGQGALDTAQRLQANLPGARLHGLRSRVPQASVGFDELGPHLRALYRGGTPIVALFAAGIVIRSLASALTDKGNEPPVLAVAEDGSTVVPLLGGLWGVNAMARDIAHVLGVAAAITTSGEVRFGTCLLNPPQGYALASLEQGKRFVSDLLGGQSMRIVGDAPWLDTAALPVDAYAPLTLNVTPFANDETRRDELRIHPRCVAAAFDDDTAPSAQHVLEALRAHRLAARSLAVLIAPADRMSDERLAQAAAALGVPLRFIEPHSGRDAAASDQSSSGEPEHRPAHEGCRIGIPGQPRAARVLATAFQRCGELLTHPSGTVLGVASAPIDATSIGRPRGRLNVVGLGPGGAEWMAPAARAALDEASDILGYETYLKIAEPFRPDQCLHASDNRAELQRARHAFELASKGRTVTVVSSGDPGVFAMAAAVMEALDGADDVRWHTVELRIVPGITAAMATAAAAGAPLGHDFCMLSLSDNLKPWAVIEKRLRHAAEADLVMAWYNPISRARPWQLDKALEIVRAYRNAGTRVVLGHDIGRPGAWLTSTTLGALRAEQVDMRTTVIVGSSTTRAIPRGPHGEWIYTPRWYT